MPASTTTDQKEILLRVARGDEEAFRLLYDQYRNKVYYLSWKLLHSSQEANDVVQEVFLKLWLHRLKLKDVDYFPSYLNTVVRNHVSNRLRVKAIQEVYLSDAIAEENKESITPFEAISLSQLERTLHEAIEELSPQQKKVFTLSRVEGLKHREIAEELQLSQETVKKYLVDALRAIRARLAGKGITVSMVVLLRVLFS